MRRTLFALLATGALVAIAWAQANNSNTWQTPGNQTVGGAVQLCPRAADNVAVPCTSAAAAAGTAGAGFPPGATPINAAAGGTTGATAATLAAAAGKFTYICGFSISHGSATGAVTAGDTVTGIPTSMTWVTGVPATAAGTTAPTYTINFSPCIPSSAVNTSIVVTSGANGAGGVNNFSNAWGFQL